MPTRADITSLPSRYSVARSVERLRSMNSWTVVYWRSAPRGTQPVAPLGRLGTRIFTHVLPRASRQLASTR